MNEYILAVDDDVALLKSLKKLLTLEGYYVDIESNPAIVAAKLREKRYHAVLLDVAMPGMSGLVLLKSIRQEWPTLPVIMISGQSTVASAVQALNDGAYDFIEKIIDPDRLLMVIKNAVQRRQLQEQNETIFKELQENFRMIGQSAAMKSVFQQIKAVADTPAKVLILGESGTGKELVARAIHYQSARRGKPFIEVNCAAIPGELLESELFGHKKGAFTGATEDRDGKFLAADGGTLFLDEIGDLDLGLQAKLLRVLENQEVQRIGENQTRKVNVRIVAATNQNLKERVLEKRFREDLYYRLNVMRIWIPPLRDRREDILPLTHHFLHKFNKIYNRQILSIHRRAEAFLFHHKWPGNVRELRHVMEKLMIVTPANLKEAGVDEIRRALDLSQRPAISAENGELLPLRDAKARFERQYILKVLENCDWRMNQAAEILELDRSNLFKKMQKLGIRRKNRESQ